MSECLNDNHAVGCECGASDPHSSGMAQKNDFADGKTERYDLIPSAPVRDLALLYGFGATKYAPRNWEKGFAWSRPYNALIRHLTAFWNGEELDDGPGGSGLPHITAVIWNAMALAEFMTTHPELDDRPNSGSGASI